MGKKMKKKVLLRCLLEATGFPLDWIVSHNSKTITCRYASGKGMYQLTWTSVKILLRKRKTGQEET